MSLLLKALQRHDAPSSTEPRPPKPGPPNLQPPKPPKRPRPLRQQIALN
jgi:hypothetical protein